MRCGSSGSHSFQSGRTKLLLNGNQQFRRSVWELAQDGLAADDHKPFGARDGGGGADEVFKLMSSHGVASEI